MRSIAFLLSLGLIFVIPFQNVVEVPGLGTIAKGIGLVAMLFWVLTVLNERRVRRPTAFHGAVLVYVAWNAVSLVWSIDVPETLERTLTYVQLFGLVYIVWDLCSTRSAVCAAFQAYVLGAYVSVANQLLNYGSGVAEVTNRYTATGFNSNMLALILGLGMPLAWYLVVAPPGERPASRLLRLVNLAYLPAALFAILLTASRAGFFGILPVFVLVLYSVGRMRFRLAALALGVAAALAALVIALVPQASFDRLAKTGSVVREGTWNDRLAIWRETGDIIAENPLLGTGAKSHRMAARQTQKVAHNFALSILSELGVVGFLLFLVPFALAAREVREMPRHEWSVWLTVLAIWLLNNATHDFDYAKQTWLLLGMAVASARASRPPAGARAEVLTAGGHAMPAPAHGR